MPSWWWVGCHGGAGATALAAAARAGADAGRFWPVPPSGPAYVVLVARTHATGLGAAQAAARQWAAGGVPPVVQLLGLVLVADAPARLPKQLADDARLIEGGVPRCWRLPWVEALRLGDPPGDIELPAAFQRLFQELAQLIQYGRPA